jgi:hypothetical protein
VDLIGSRSCPMAGVGVSGVRASGVYYQGVGKMHGDSRKPLYNASLDDSNASLLGTENWMMRCGWPF